MRYRTRRELHYYRNGDSLDMVTVPAGHVVDSVTLRRLDPWNRQSFKKQMDRDRDEGYPRGRLVIFRFADGWRYAYSPADLEGVTGWDGGVQ